MRGGRVGAGRGGEGEQTNCRDVQKNAFHPGSKVTPPLSDVPEVQSGLSFQCDFTDIPKGAPTWVFLAQGSSCGN